MKHDLISFFMMIKNFCTEYYYIQTLRRALHYLILIADKPYLAIPFLRPYVTHLLPVIKSEAHEPDFTLFVVKLLDDGDISIVVL